jgi:hypothetical protein
MTIRFDRIDLIAASITIATIAAILAFVPGPIH